MQSCTLSVMFLSVVGTRFANGLKTRAAPVENSSSVQPWWTKSHENSIPTPDQHKWWFERDGVTIQPGFSGPLQDSGKKMFSVDKPVFQNLADAWKNKLGLGTPVFVTRQINFHDQLPPFNYMFPLGDADQKQVYDQGILHSFASYHFVEDMKECCRSGSGRFVDVGSTYGWYSLLASSLGCQVESFESVPWSGALRDYNVKVLNHKLIREKIKLHHPQLLSNTSNQMRTLVVPLRDGAKACAEGAQCFSAATTTIDNEIKWQANDLIKTCGMNINAQGFEPETIDGGKQFIQKYQPEIIALDVSPSKAKLIGRNINDHVNMFDTLIGQLKYEPHLLKLEALKTYNQAVMKGSMASKKTKAKAPQLMTDCGQQCTIYMKHATA